MKLEDASFTVFDVETTGLYPYSGDRICEIGAVRISADKKTVIKFHSLIDPERPISRAARSVNGITDDMVMGRPTADKVLPGFTRFMRGSVLVAYNAGFDLGFLECSTKEQWDVISRHYIIDALELARRLFPGIGRYNLGSVAHALGIVSETEHRAMADAVMTWKVFDAELKSLRSQGVSTIEEIGYIPARGRRPLLTLNDRRLALIESAILKHKRLKIVYRSSWNEAVTTRTITPKRIHRGYDRLYIVARCHAKNADRNFRLDCIADVEEY